MALKVGTAFVAVHLVEFLVAELRQNIQTLSPSNLASEFLHYHPKVLGGSAATVFCYFGPHSRLLLTKVLPYLMPLYDMAPVSRALWLVIATLELETCTLLSIASVFLDLHMLQKFRKCSIRLYALELRVCIECV